MMAKKENCGSDHVALHSDFGCAVCMKTSTVFREKTGIEMLSCSKCRGPRRYCSKECFKKDWGEFGHKEECKLFSAECVIDNPKKKAAEAIDLKNEANKLFKSGRYKEAICEYRKVKILAIKVKDFVRNERKQNKKNEKENVEKVCSYVKNTINKDCELEAELQIYHRSDPLEIEMTRLSAIAANNTAITYNKMNMYREASAAAREALKLDPRFHYRIIPQWLHSLKLVNSEREMLSTLKEEWTKMKYRIHYLQQLLHSGINSPCSLYEADFISFKELFKLGNDLLYEIIDKERKLAEEGSNRFCPASDSPCVADKWGYVNVSVCMVPAHGAQWLELCIENHRNANALHVKHFGLRHRPINVGKSGKEFSEKMAKDGYNFDIFSHVASMEALKIAHREIILFVHDLEREGLAVEYVVLGCCLLHLLPEEKDPQKEKRKHKHEADKYILYPGHYLPSYCQIESDYYAMPST